MHPRSVAMPACKPLQCQACGHLSRVVRGARQLTAGGVAPASGPAASAVADNAVFALNALFHALYKDRCMSGHPQETFMQGGLTGAEVRVSLLVKVCSRVLCFLPRSGTACAPSSRCGAERPA